MMIREPEDVEELTEAQAKKLLAQLVETLNDLDGDDYFGTEGWRHFMNF